MRSKKRVINTANPDKTASKSAKNENNLRIPSSERKTHRIPARTEPKTKKLKTKTKQKSKYKLVKRTTLTLNFMIRKRYKTRICFILIAICHSLYLLMNFIVMSQAGLAAFALQGLSHLNLACKLSFMLFPPTTVYNLLHQLAIWLLVYAIRQHGLKLRHTQTHNFDEDADYDVHLMQPDLSLISSDDSDDTEDDAPTSSSDNNSKRNAYDTYDESNADEDDTVSQSLTNNSNELAHKSTVQFMELAAYSNSNQPQQQRFPVLAPAHLQIMATNHYHQHHHIALAGPAPPPISAAQPKPARTHSGCLCYLFSPKRKNALFCAGLLVALLAYNGQNLLLYSLSRLQTSPVNFISYCAFDESYADYYVLLTQLVVPLANLCLFSLLPLLLCTMQVLFDVCFLVRVQREQLKRYLKLKDIIEWPLYAYYAVYVLSQLPFAVHQINDLIAGTVKFPFVFPLFIQLKFSSRVWLAVFEMSLMCAAYSADFFIWIACDKELRQLAKLWLNKRILCRTYAKQPSAVSSGEAKSKSKTKRSSLSTDESNSCGGLSSSNRSDLNSPNALHKAKIGSSSSTSTATTGVPQPNQNSYASSTLSSTSSLGGKKKSISPIITESIKATAAISASLTHHNDMYSQDNQAGTAIPIRMIDTDNEDAEGGHERHRLDKLDEGDESKKFSTHKHASLNSNPPSFKSAIAKSQFQSHGEYKNPYQNDFDLNIHPTAQAKVQNY